MTDTATTTDRRYVADTFLADRYDTSRVTIWRWARQGTFPKPVKLGPNCTRWRLEDVEAWEAQQVAAEAAAIPAEGGL